MELYRISRTAHAGDISGEGARRVGGRWNHPGLPVVYSAESLALAILETIVHMDPHLPMDRSLLVLNVSDKVSIETVKDLPPGWWGYPAPDRIVQIGSDWIRGNSSLLLRVPSAIPGQLDPSLWQYNVLINPAHPEFSTIEIDRVVRWEPDSRLC